MIHFGLQLHPQYTTWEELRDTALLIDQLGYDSLWTWDHFVPLFGDASGPDLEGWQLLPAWAAITRRVRIGMLVTGNTYRHPAVLANMVSTLDHISGGRAILGLGASWHEREHAMYGIPFDTPGVRLAKLAEAAPIIRSLLEQPRTSFAGRHYTITDAVCEPKPVQARLPLMIGGGGERKTLRITARHADMWHGFGTPDVLRHKLEVLKRHCEEVGRDAGAILPTTGGPALIRDDPAAVDARMRVVAERNRAGRNLSRPASGTVEQIAAELADRWRAGLRGFIFGLNPPYDRETIERMIGEVKPRLEEMVLG
ncbi:MAG: TIGR03560 family F420-dependent LLM class oxidoreductase [Candidatus Limnocylindria bacterium]